MIAREVDGERLAQVNRLVQLRDIRTVEVHARALGPTPTSAVDTKLEIKSELNTHVEPGALRILTSFHVTASDPKVGAYLECVYRVVASYTVGRDTPLTPDELETFAPTNGMVHVYPYFRAFLQSASAQLALPTLIAPPFRVVAKRDGAKG